MLSHYGIRFCLLKTITLGPSCMWHNSLDSENLFIQTTKTERCKTMNSYSDQTLTMHGCGILLNSHLRFLILSSPNLEKKIFSWIKMKIKLFLRPREKWKENSCSCLSQPSREWQQRWEQSAWLAAVNWEENCCITFLIDSIKEYIYLCKKRNSKTFANWGNGMLCYV